MRERDIAQALAEREGGQCEVRTPAGNIDVLTPKYLYEVKVAHLWKAALGQVLAYARAYPNHTPRLYLFGEQGAITKKAIEEHCRDAGVGVVWHRDEDAPPRAPQVPKIIEDAMSLRLVAVDATYGIRASTKINLPAPVASISREVLDVYADEALAVFDALLDNVLTITVTVSYGGERQVVERTRESIRGYPVCYQLHVTATSSHPRASVSVSLPGIKKPLLSFTGGHVDLYRIDHSQRKLPALDRLTVFVTHPSFPWTTVHGFPAQRVESMRLVNYGIRHTKDGPKMGGR